MPARSSPRERHHRYARYRLPTEMGSKASIGYARHCCVKGDDSKRNYQVVARDFL